MKERLRVGHGELLYQLTGCSPPHDPLSFVPAHFRAGHNELGDALTVTSSARTQTILVTLSVDLAKVHYSGTYRGQLLSLDPRVNDSSTTIEISRPSGPSPVWPVLAGVLGVLLAFLVVGYREWAAASDGGSTFGDYFRWIARWVRTPKGSWWALGAGVAAGAGVGYARYKVATWTGSIPDLGALAAAVGTAFVTAAVVATAKHERAVLPHLDFVRAVTRGSADRESSAHGGRLAVSKTASRLPRLDPDGSRVRVRPQTSSLQTLVGLQLREGGP